jgi:hypothetical protein
MLPRARAKDADGCFRLFSRADLLVTLPARLM